MAEQTQVVELWSHQKEIIELCQGLPGYGLFLQMGTGKSGTAIGILRRIMNEKKRVARALIFTPPMVVPQWKEEFKRFSKLDPKQVVLLQGSGKDRLKAFTKYGFDICGDVLPRIFVTNYEALLMKELYAAFQKWGVEALIWDESHRLKNPSAMRSKLAATLSNPWDVARKVPKEKPKTYILTGSPVLNSPLDLFQQVKVMLGGFPTPAWFTNRVQFNLIDNFFMFRARYFRDRNAGIPKDRYFPNWQPMTLKQDGFDALGEIEMILKRISYRKTKEECLDLPDEVSVIMRVGMSREQARMYEEMRKNLITYLGDSACVATLAITKALRLMQITSGFASLTGQGEENDAVDKQFEASPKEEALAELLEEITPNQKVLVWAVWRENYAAIRRVCEKLGLEYVEAHGGISEAKKRANVERFKTDAKVKVFFGHPGSGGIGLNLTCAPYSIFYSRTFSLEHYLQARSRNHRGGQTHKVTHYDLVCHNTIDELALEKLAAKQEIGAKLLGDLVKDLAKPLETD